MTTNKTIVHADSVEVVVDDEGGKVASWTYGDLLQVCFYDRTRWDRKWARFQGDLDMSKVYGAYQFLSGPRKGEDFCRAYEPGTPAVAVRDDLLNATGLGIADDQAESENPNYSCALKTVEKIIGEDAINAAMVHDRTRAYAESLVSEGYDMSRWPAQKPLLRPVEEYKYYDAEGCNYVWVYPGGSQVVVCDGMGTMKGKMVARIRTRDGEEGAPRFFDSGDNPVFAKNSLFDERSVYIPREQLLESASSIPIAPKKNSAGMEAAYATYGKGYVEKKQAAVMAKYDRDNLVTDVLIAISIVLIAAALLAVAYFALAAAWAWVVANKWLVIGLVLLLIAGSVPVVHVI